MLTVMGLRAAELQVTRPEFAAATVPLGSKEASTVSERFQVYCGMTVGIGQPVG